MSDFYLHPQAREYLKWEISGVPVDATVEISFDGGTAWHALARDVDTFSILVRGSEVGDTTPASQQLSGVDIRPLIRVTDTAEIIIDVVDVIHVSAP